LVGGIESVTLSDEEARRRGTQKTILERRAPPTFDVLIEIQDRQRLSIHHSVKESVDAMLRGQPLQTELRYRDQEGDVQSQQVQPPSLEERASSRNGTRPAQSGPPQRETALKPMVVFPYGLARNRLDRAAKRMQVPINIVKDLGEADALITTKAFYRKRPRIIVDAERRGLPIYVLRANTVAQMEACLSDMFDLENRPSNPLYQALAETREAIRQVEEGAPMVELSPQNAYTRRRQHELVNASDLTSYSVGSEPDRRVCVSREG
jgi:hypothetical protein